MNRFFIALGFAVVLAVPPVAAKPKPRSLVGCVQGRQGQYALVTTSQNKGKSREYTLRGDHDFAKDIGHRVRVAGLLSKGVLAVSSVQTVAASCR